VIQELLRYVGFFKKLWSPWDEPLKGIVGLPFNVNWMKLRDNTCKENP
jgi:hypothetical protein